jgi:hypothetical protein
VALVRTDVSEDPGASFIRVIIFCLYIGISAHPFGIEIAYTFRAPPPPTHVPVQPNITFAAIF